MNMNMNNSFERTSGIQIHQVLIHWIITYEMRRSRYTNYVTRQSRPTLIRNWRTLCKRSARTCLRPKLMQQYCRSQKAAGGHFEHDVWIDFTSINMSRFFTIIKTVSISWNWTDQLLFTYKIALCSSRSHCVCGKSILIKFVPLTDVSWH